MGMGIILIFYLIVKKIRGSRKQIITKYISTLKNHNEYRKILLIKTHPLFRI